LYVTAARGWQPPGPAIFPALDAEIDLHGRVTILLVVVATAAPAQGTTENPTLSPTGMTSTGDQNSIGLTISTKADETLVLRQAALVDEASR